MFPVFFSFLTSLLNSGKAAQILRADTPRSMQNNPARASFVIYKSLEFATRFVPKGSRLASPSLARGFRFSRIAGRLSLAHIHARHLAFLDAFLKRPYFISRSPAPSARARCRGHAALLFHDFKLALGFARAQARHMKIISQGLTASLEWLLPLENS